ncbi:LysR substrate-binding domain-containing protein [Microvirga sp. W0021]|uniref:LysR substrate-binding domain-containing protein n=1 Tax=Hohaiivirga grylli TaxID=3133970 RepID=A0ABV0BES1_9HYPH
MFDTDQLRSFIAIVDTGSFTRAAQRVNKTQSAVSMHIRRLEEMLGKALFAKAGRGARLTESGEQLIEYARNILHTEAVALEAISGKGLRGRIRFGIPDDYAEAFFSDIMSCFSMRHPLAEMLVSCESSTQLVEQINSGDLDVALLTVLSDMTDADIEILREEPLLWVAAKNNTIEYERPLPVALSSKECEWRIAAQDALTIAGIPMKHALTSRNYAAISKAVAAGLAVTPLPESIIPRDFRVVSEEAGLPKLGKCRMGLMVSPTSRVDGLKTLTDLIREVVGMRSQTIQ